MNWIEVSIDLSLPKGTELIALRKRSKFPSLWETPGKVTWQLLEPIIVARVGDICGEQHPDKDELRWYGKGYTSAHYRPSDSFSHYMLLSELTLPPVAAPTPEEIEARREWTEASRRRWAAFDDMLLNALKASK